MIEAAVEGDAGKDRKQNGGTTAITLNRLTMRTCNCAPAAWRRLASHNPVTCQAMIITMAITSTRLMRSMPTTTRWVGTMGVRPVRIT